MAGKGPGSDLRREMVEVARRAYRQGLSPGTSGNLSARLPGKPLVWIKRTGRALGDLEEADLLLVDLEGHPVEGQGVPSVEFPFHLALYRCRPEIGAVLHLHSPYATAFAVAGREIAPAGLAAEYGLERIPLVGYAPPGSTELAGLVEKAFNDGRVRAALLAGHGQVTVGSDPRHALYLAETVEALAQVAFLARGLLASIDIFLPGMVE